MESYIAKLEKDLESGTVRYGELDAGDMREVAMDSMGIDEEELVEKVMRGIFCAAKSGLTTCRLASVLDYEPSLLMEKVIAPRLVIAGFRVEHDNLIGCRISW